MDMRENPRGPDKPALGPSPAAPHRESRTLVELIGNHELDHADELDVADVPMTPIASR